MAKTNKGRKFFATTATAALVASAIVPVASAAQVNDFNSIASYAQEAVQDLVDRGVITGDQNGNFQPRKSVSRAEAATILTGALGLTTSDNVYFKDVKSGAWYYDAINAAVNNGVFAGKGAGVFEPNGNLTRGEAAIILVNAFKLDGRASLAQFSDEKSVKEWAVKSLEIAVGNGVIKGDNGKIGANNAITKQDFAVMFSRAEAAAEAVNAHTVKAVNATTVEVTFPEAITDVAKINFAIEGLQISNKVVKQTDSKTVVLTTSAHEAGKEYTVTVDGDAVGKFKGVAEVIPTKIDVTTTSVQGVIGEEVTLTAKVTVPQGQSVENVPVTFNILNNERANDKIEAEVLTKADGTATYKYTRYYNSEDTFTAYATKKSSVFSTGKVYWANKVQLAVTELTAGNDLANETKKSYKVTGKANATYYIAIKENLNVAPDKITDVKVQNHNSNNFVTPYELTTGATSFATVTTNAAGEGSFTVYGSNLEATPIVYAPESTPTTNNSKTYTALDLQAVAPTVKFSKVDRLALTVAGIGTADSAQYFTAPVAYNTNSAGGRSYEVTVTDKEGKLAPEGSTAYVAFPTGSISTNTADSVYFTTGENNFSLVKTGDVFAIKVGKDGKAQFRVAGKGATAFVKPTVFLNTTGDVTPAKLDTNDVQQVAEVTYFKAPVVTNAVLTVKDALGRTITSTTAGQDAYFTYQSVDQNGFAYRPTTVISGQTVTIWKPVYVNGAIVGYQQVQEQVTPDTRNHVFTLAFDVTSTFGNAVVKDANGVALPALQNLGNTKTYYVNSNQEGTAVVRVTSQSADTVSVNVTGASNILPTANATVNFTDSNIVPDSYSGNVTSYDSVRGTLTFAGKNPVTLYGDKIRYTKGNEVIANYDAFVALLANATGTVSVTRTVGTDGVTTFNIYNISTSGTKPVDTATTTTVDQQLAAAKANAATKVQADYTAASWTALQNALALPEATTSEKSAKTTAINTAINGLVAAPEALEGVVVTSFQATTANSVTEALGIYSDYSVAGTVADASISSVELVYTLEDNTQSTRTVAVANGAFAETVAASAFTGAVKSVKVKVGSKTTTDKAVTVVKAQ